MGDPWRQGVAGPTPCRGRGSLEATLQRAHADAQDLRGGDLVAPGLLEEDLLDVEGLELAQRGMQLGARVLRQQRWTCAEIAAAVGVSNNLMLGWLSPTQLTLRRRTIALADMPRQRRTLAVSPICWYAFITLP